MDNNELDKIIKDRLKDTIKPSKEFEQKIIQKIEEEKQKASLAKNLNKTEEINNANNFKNNVQQKDKTQRFKRFNNFAKILSIAAVFLIIFTLGMNLNNNTPIIGNEPQANLIRIKTIEPTKLESGTVAKDSEFTIFVEGDNVTKEAVQKSVYVEPALEYTIEKTANTNEFKLKFKQNIPDNTILKLQYVKNQITEDSWAYQTSNKFSVNNTYPDNGEEMVPKNSTIEIEFSYANVKNLEKYVSISPAIKGNWKNLGRIWRFEPSTALEKGQKYTVVISKNLIAENQKLESDYKFTFEVEGKNGEIVEYRPISMDRIITSKSNEIVKIPFHTYEIQFGKVEIAKFSNIDEFIDYLQTSNYSKAVKQGDYEINKTEKNLEFKQTLPKGYYVAKVKSTNGKEFFNCPIQISDISAYAMETERDILVWVAKGNDLASNVDVEYNGKSFKTDKQGIAKLQNATDGTKTIKYAKVANELVIGLYNYSFENYPRAYVYTDRPLYKSTDTINIWGFVPKDFFYDKLEDEFYIVLDEGEKQKIKLQEDGTFSYKIDLKNHIDQDYAGISLYYKDTEIGGRVFKIENYELQNYTYEVSCNKNYGFIGDKIDFDVKVKHITGILVPNKNVVAVYEEKTYRAKTGADGIAHFSITLTGEDSQNTEPNYQGISIYNGDEIEYTNSETELETKLLTRNVYAERDYKVENRYKATLYKLDTSKNVELDYDLKNIYNGTYETDVEVYLIETVDTKVQNGEEYDEYTKQMVPHYERVEKENRTKLKNIRSKNGVIEFNFNEVKQKLDTELQTYWYTLEFNFKDTEGRNVIEKQQIHKDWRNETQYGYSAGFIENEESDNRLGEIQNDFGNEDYYTYRFLWDFDLGYPTKFINGKKIEFKLQEATKLGRRDIENNGKVLNIFFKENISETEIISNNNFTREFTDKDFPGIKMTSAYFVNGRFYRMPDRYFDIDEDSKKVDVEITSDKETYKPGEEVTLNIKTTKNGKAVKSTVNVSVANEAVFELQEDETNILHTIYSDKALAVYTYSSYYDDISSPSGGAGGGDGEPRGKFADTAHFETVSTDNNGVAKVKFKLPDNVTTYRVTAHSANKDLDVGVGTKKITSKLDFFVQSVEPRGVKVTDDLVLNATAIADTSYDVNYEFAIKELNKTFNAKGKTNSIVTANFGRLPLGTYTAIISGKHGEQTDAIEYKFSIIKSSQEVKAKTTMNITSNTTIKPTKNPIVLEIYNKKLERNVKYIDFIESTLTERLDTQIAYNEVQNLKNKYYETDIYSINSINSGLYTGSGKGLKNLRSGKNDLVLTAMVSYYAREYSANVFLNELEKNDNLFEYYLWLASQQKPVLQDLMYLKQEKDISNYNKLLVTLSFEFLGDYKNAKDLYSQISLSSEEAKRYKSITATIETFINKDKAIEKIDNMIKELPSDEYLRFAILSYFKNNSDEIGEEENVIVKMKGKQKNVSVNGVKIQKLNINNEELADISFETDSNDLMVSYYYQTSLEEISNKNIKKDIKASLSGNMQVGKTVNLRVEFSEDYEGEVKIALPNSLRLSQAQKEYDENSKYYIQNNKIDYITIYKTKKCKTINLQLIVTNTGKYKFENIVCNVEGIYHISNTVDFSVK